MMPTALFPTFSPLHSRVGEYTTPTHTSAALETKTTFTKSRSLHRICPIYHSILLRPSRVPLTIFSTLKPSITIENEKEMEKFTCEDFKVGKCKGQKLVDGVTMPLVLQPQEDQPNSSNEMQPLLRALEKNNDWFKQMIIENGAVLLRGFNVRNAEDFHDVVQTFGWEHVPYVGPAIRTTVYKGIWTANEGPLTETIEFHHEMVIMKEFPEFIMFFCEVPPPEGGETPIGPSYRVAQRMMEEFPEETKEMEEKGLKYTFKVAPQRTSTFTGRSWSEFLGSSDPAEAAKMAKANVDLDVEMLPDGSATMIAAQRPLTVVFDGRKGRKVWFNQIHLIYRKASVTMMDGTEIPEHFARRLEEIIEEESIQFRWEKGDVLFLDNLAMYHGRRPSLPPRRVLVATGKKQVLAV